jgi:dihydrofolate synthase/folylpolyglutamate synthase
VERLGPAGRHQIDNAKVAILVAEELSRRFNILRADVILGLQSASHAGRLERVGNVLLDGAHNSAGAYALRSFLEEFVTSPITLVFGAMCDKRVEEITAALFPVVREIVLTKPHNQRSMEFDELLKRSLRETWRRKPVHLEADSAKALRTAIELAGTEGIVLVTGSLYLVGEAKRILAERSEI